MSNVNFANYTHINLAFALPQQDGTLTFDGEKHLEETVLKLRATDTKVLLSVGGWSGEDSFPNILKNTIARRTLTFSIIGIMQEYYLDGVDINWEYPGREVNENNEAERAGDVVKFYYFLLGLREQMDKAFGAGKLITLALRLKPFDVPVSYIYNVTHFTRVVDWGNLMQYDVNGPWGETTGPNAPLNFAPGNGTQLSFASAIDEWTRAGWPPGQLTGGVAFYGRAMTAVKDMMLDPENQYQPKSKTHPFGDSDDVLLFPGHGQPPMYTGIWKWRNLRSEGVLNSTASVRKPWVRNWDPVTQTPWLYNPTNKMFISYDDPDSLTAKVNYAKKQRLKGMMVWSVDQDRNGELLSVLRKVYGY